MSDSNGRAVSVLDSTAALEQAVVAGDLSKLGAGERVAYYSRVCQSLGLNPLTKPFDYINLNGKLTLYAKRDATDQLRKRDGVSIVGLERERLEDVYVVTARARTLDGRTDEAIGAVSIANLKGEALANAMMKAETKAKRRVTLSIVGLGWLDETEVDSVPEARVIPVDEDGVILEPVAAPIPRANNRQKLLDAYTERFREADALGLDPEPLPDNASDDLIIAMGRALAARITEAKAH